MNPDYSDQLNIFNHRRFVDTIHVIGCGGIGSALIPLLLKLGVRQIHIWDPDVVEPHNLPCQQMYRPSDVGTLKVLAVQAYAKWQEVDCEIIVHAERVNANTSLEGVVIVCVDSMTSRKAIWEAVQASLEFVTFFMDGRIGGEEWQLLSFAPSNVGAITIYEEDELFDDAEAAQLACAARTVIHPAANLASQMIGQLTLFARKEVIAEGIRYNMHDRKYKRTEYPTE